MTSDEDVAREVAGLFLTGSKPKRKRAKPGRCIDCRRVSKRVRCDDCTRERRDFREAIPDEVIAALNVQLGTDGVVAWLKQLGVELPAGMTWSRLANMTTFAALDLKYGRDVASGGTAAPPLGAPSPATPTTNRKEHDMATATSYKPKKDDRVRYLPNGKDTGTITEIGKGDRKGKVRVDWDNLRAAWVGVANLGPETVEAEGAETV